MKRIFFVVLSCGVGVSGCFPKFSSKEDGRVINPPFRQKPDAPDEPTSAAVKESINFEVQDRACQTSGSAVETLSPLRPFQIADGRVFQDEFGWDQGTSSPSLSTAFITETKFDFHQRVKCSYKDKKLDCGSTPTIVDQGKLLKVCDSSISLQRKSLESIAVTSLASLDRANQFYNAVRGVEKVLPTARLLVMPKIEKDVEISSSSGQVARKSLFDSDNLAYGAKFNGGPTFIVYPRGATSVKLGLWKDFQLWESSWVLAHEFGHHIFRNIASTLGSGRALSMIRDQSPIISLDRDTSYDDEGFGLASDTSNIKRVFGALNESFADLFGHFSNGMKSPGMYELDCFKKSRDVLSDRYIDGTPKSLTSSVLDVFFRRKPNPNADEERCEIPDFEDVHAMGAIVARGVFEIMRTSGKISESPKAYGEALIAWAEQMIADVEVTKATSEDAFFAEMLGSLLRSLKISSDQSEVCATLTRSFPVLKSRITSGTELRCP